MLLVGRRASGALNSACPQGILRQNQRCISTRSHGPMSFTLSVGESASKVVAHNHFLIGPFELTSNRNKL